MIVIRFCINYMFFWAVWNWKISLTLYWFQQYLTEQTEHANLPDYLSHAMPNAEHLYPALTAIAAMIILPIIDKYIMKLNNLINKTLKL